MSKTDRLWLPSREIEYRFNEIVADASYKRLRNPDPDPDVPVHLIRMDAYTDAASLGWLPHVLEIMTKRLAERNPDYLGYIGFDLEITTFDKLKLKL